MSVHEDPFWLSPPVFDNDAWGLTGDDVVPPEERGRLYDAFYNKNHDERGRFARKDGAAPAVAEPDVSYRGLHQPDPDGPPANNLLDQSGEWGMPDDVYDHPEFYTGDPRSDWAKETIRVLREYRGKPDDTPITVYRAAPGPINPGDWVTLSRAYAEQHAMSSNDPADDLPIQEATVPVGSVRFAGDDLSEFGYFPHKVTAAATIGRRVEFANPNHDRRGRFARKGEGRAVPTKGVDGGIDEARPRVDDPNQGDLFAPSTSSDPGARTGAVQAPPADKVPVAQTAPPPPDQITAVEWKDGSSAELLYKGVVDDPGAAPFGVPTVERWRYTSADGVVREFQVVPGSGWVAVDPQAKQILDETIAITAHLGEDPVTVRFGDQRLAGSGAYAGVHSDNPHRILVGDREMWEPFFFAVADDLMPAAKDRLEEGGVSQARYVMAHEMGHVRDARTGRRENHDNVTRALIERGLMPDPHKSTVDAFEKAMRDAGFSKYAISNIAENIAETHAQLLVDGVESLAPGPLVVAEAMGWLPRPGGALTVTPAPQHRSYTVAMQRQNDPEDGLIVDTFVADEPDMDGWAQLWDAVVNAGQDADQ